MKSIDQLGTDTATRRCGLRYFAHQSPKVVRVPNKRLVEEANEKREKINKTLNRIPPEIILGL